MRSVPLRTLALSLAAWFPAVAQAGGGYTPTFVNIADNSGPFDLIQQPSINNDGTVVFFANFNPIGIAGIFAGNGGPLRTVVDTTGPFNGVTPAGINDAGTVAFLASRDAGGTGVYLAQGSGGMGGGTVTMIADSVGPLSTFSTAVLNSGGGTAFVAGLDAGGTGLVVSLSGGPATIIADSSGPLNFFMSTVSMNDAGTVAFAATYDAGGAGLFLAQPGGGFTTLVDTSGPFNTLSSPSLNDHGDIAFIASFDSGPGRGILKGAADGTGGFALIVDTLGAFSTVNLPAINESGAVAFLATLDAGPTGVFISDGLTSTKVIQTGDALFGSTVTALNFMRGFNDHGDVAFEYTLATGVRGIAVARTIPAPSSGAACLLGLGSVLSRRRRGGGGDRESGGGKAGDFSRNLGNGSRTRVSLA